MKNPQRFQLPYPPSANHRLTLAKGKFFKNTKYKEYEWRVHEALAKQKVQKYAASAKLGMKLTINYPDKRLRDLDNILKCLWDSCQLAGLYENDHQLWHLHLDRAPLVVPNGMVVCEIWEIEEETLATN